MDQNWHGPRNNMVNSTEGSPAEYRGLPASVPNGFYGPGHNRSQRAPYNSAYIGINGGYNDSNNSVHYSHFYNTNDSVSSSASPEEMTSHSPISYTSNAWNVSDPRQPPAAYATTPRHYPHAFGNSATFLPPTGTTPHPHPSHQQQYFASGGCSAGYMNTPFPLDMTGAELRRVAFLQLSPQHLGELREDRTPSYRFTS
ncbi:hypothetical protein HOLleu_20490 [Holothuria leucospilota]|uniref:Uncharacterized protein n=1 Tax=Holothuria leucospilota TaxID=206669 RepID=A0A9Q1H5Q9_HOLLE|nr:hypothetical protein HOLleu_20490 [Holothuria leucospilota]